MHQTNTGMPYGHDSYHQTPQGGPRTHPGVPSAHETHQEIDVHTSQKTLMMGLGGALVAGLLGGMIVASLFGVKEHDHPDVAKQISILEASISSLEEKVKTLHNENEEQKEKEKEKEKDEEDEENKKEGKSEEDSSDTEKLKEKTQSEEEKNEDEEEKGAEKGEKIIGGSGEDTAVNLSGTISSGSTLSGLTLSGDSLLGDTFSLTGELLMMSGTDNASGTLSPFGENQTGLILPGELISLDESSNDLNLEDNEKPESEGENTTTETGSTTEDENIEPIKPVLGYELINREKQYLKVGDTVKWRVSLESLQKNQSYTIKMKSDKYQTRITDSNSQNIRQSTKRGENRIWQFDNPSQTGLTIDIVTRIDSLPPKNRDEDICGRNPDFGESDHSFWDSSISVFSEGMTVKDRECLVISS